MKSLLVNEPKVCADSPYEADLSIEQPYEADCSIEQPYEADCSIEQPYAEASNEADNADEGGPVEQSYTEETEICVDEAGESFDSPYEAAESFDSPYVEADSFVSNVEADSFVSNVEADSFVSNVEVEGSVEPSYVKHLMKQIMPKLIASRLLLKQNKSSQVMSR